jgi:hypothetical protein
MRSRGSSSNTEPIPEDVRSKVKKWSDYIDYWAADWDFQNDTFMQGWVAYRTRKEREFVSDPHPYEKPGRCRILVKVIDIFGNDTSQAFDVEVVLSSVIAYEKDLPEILGRRPWEKPTSYLVKDDAATGWREEPSGRRPSRLLARVEDPCRSGRVAGW